LIWRRDQIFEDSGDVKPSYYFRHRVSSTLREQLLVHYTWCRNNDR